VKPAVVALAAAAGWVLAPNKLPAPAATPLNEAAVAVSAAAVHDGVPNENICDDGVPNENPPTPVPPAVDEVVLGVNWNPPDIISATKQSIYDLNKHDKNNKTSHIFFFVSYHVTDLTTIPITVPKNAS